VYAIARDAHRLTERALLHLLHLGARLGGELARRLGEETEERAGRRPVAGIEHDRPPCLAQRLGARGRVPCGERAIRRVAGRLRVARRDLAPAHQIAIAVQVILDRVAQPRARWGSDRPTPARSRGRRSPRAPARISRSGARALGRASAPLSVSTRMRSAVSPP